MKITAFTITKHSPEIGQSIAIYYEDTFLKNERFRISEGIRLNEKEFVVFTEREDSFVNIEDHSHIAVLGWMPLKKAKGLINEKNKGYKSANVKRNILSDICVYLLSFISFIALSNSGIYILRSHAHSTIFTIFGCLMITWGFIIGAFLLIYLIFEITEWM